jgi:hypothetical protein
LLFTFTLLAQVTTFTPGKTISKSGNNDESIKIIGINNHTDVEGIAVGGTLDVPTATPNNTNLLSLLGSGHTGLAFTNTAKSKILFQSTQNWTVGATGSNISFWTTPNGTISSLQRMIISNVGKIGIGIDIPTYNLTVLQDELSDDGVGLKRIGGDAPSFFGVSLRGTIANPTATLSGDILARFGGRGHDGSAETNAKARIEFNANQNWTSTATGADIRFYTTKGGTNDATEKIVINGNGNVGIGDTEPASKLTVNGDLQLATDSHDLAINQEITYTALNRNGKSIIYFRAPYQAKVHIKGIAGGVDGLIIHIVSTSLGDVTLYFLDQDAPSENRILTGENYASPTQNPNLQIKGEGGCTLVYDGAYSVWRVIGWRE